jgi:hypothetical protein
MRDINTAFGLLSRLFKESIVLTEIRYAHKTYHFVTKNLDNMIRCFIVLNMTEIEMLRSMEKRYEIALGKIRDLIVFCEGSNHTTANAPASTKTDGVISAGVRVRTRCPPGFSTMKKGDASEAVFKERGDLHVDELYQIMKERGHAVASPRSLISMLSTDERFAPRGKGVWGLQQPELPKQEKEEN